MLGTPRALGSTEQWAPGGLTVPPAEGSREAAGRAADPVLVSCCARGQKMAGMLGPQGGRRRKGFGEGSEHALEKAVTPHSSTLAWKLPWTEEPGGLQSMGLLRVRHD